VNGFEAGMVFEAGVVCQSGYEGKAEECG